MPFLGVTSSASPGESSPVQHNPKGILLTAAQLLMAGAAMVVLQASHHMGGTLEELRLFCAILFGVAVPLSAVAWFVLERRISLIDVIYGCFLGRWNALSAFMLVKATKH